MSQGESVVCSLPQLTPAGCASAARYVAVADTDGRLQLRRPFRGSLPLGETGVTRCARHGSSPGGGAEPDLEPGATGSHRLRLALRRQNHLEAVLAVVLDLVQRLVLVKGLEDGSELLLRPAVRLRDGAGQLLHAARLVVGSQLRLDDGAGECLVGHLQLPIYLSLTITLRPLPNHVSRIAAKVAKDKLKGSYTTPLCCMSKHFLCCVSMFNRPLHIALMYK